MCTDLGYLWFGLISSEWWKKRKEKCTPYCVIFSERIYQWTYAPLLLAYLFFTLLPLHPGTPGIPRGPIAPGCPGKPFWPSMGNKPSSPYFFLIKTKDIEEEAKLTRSPLLPYWPRSPFSPPRPEIPGRPDGPFRPRSPGTPGKPCGPRERERRRKKCTD